MQKSKCIYCLEEKPISDFNSEHVISRFMGTYKNAYTLHEAQVCRKCNSYFCTELENEASFDSFEGLCRIQCSEKPLSVKRAIGMNRLKVTGENGIFKNMPLHISSDPRSSGNIQITPAPVVGIILDKDSGIYEYYSLDTIPECDDNMLARIEGTKQPYVVFNCEEKDALRALTEHGYDLSKAKYRDNLHLEDVTEEKVLNTQINCKVDAKLMRLAAKNIFNYFCYAYGKDTAISPALNGIRSFIRHGYVDNNLKMFPNHSGIKGIPEITNNDHVVGFEWAIIDKRIHLCGFLSWFNSMTYTFALCPVHTSVVNLLPPLKLIQCDNNNRKIIENEYLTCFEWPGEQIKMAFIDENGCPIVEGSDNNA